MRRQERAPLSSLLQRLRVQRNALFAGSLAFVVSLHPIFPVLTGGAVFPAELQARNLGVADFTLLRRAGSEVLDKRIGKGSPRLAIKNVRLEPFAGPERESYVAAIVEGLLKSDAQVLFVNQFGNPALELLVYGTRSNFQRFNLLARIFQHLGAHALVSS